MTTNAMPPSAAAEMQKALAEPFPADVVGWKAQTTSRDKTRALAVPYIDARDVMDRLDAVVGVAGWTDSYQVQADGSVVCTLSVLIAGEWVGKQDVGGQSDQPDEHDKAKAAFSDALKRAAVKFGVARYLYRLPQTWVAYDEQRKQLKETPSLPPWALPHKAQPQRKGEATPTAAPVPVASGAGSGTAGEQPGGSGSAGGGTVAPRPKASPEQLERLTILYEQLTLPEQKALDANMTGWVGTDDFNALSAVQADKLIKKLTPADAPSGTAQKAGSAA